MKHSERWLRLSEVAKRLGYSRQGLYRYVKEGKIEVEKLGMVLVVPLREVERLEERLKKYGKYTMFK